MNAILLSLVFSVTPTQIEAAARLAYAAQAVEQSGVLFEASPQAKPLDPAPAETPKPRSAPDEADGPAVQAFVFTMSGCLPCRRLEASVARNLVPQGWRVSGDDDADIRYVTWEKQRSLFAKHKVEQTPTIVLIKNGKECKRWESAIHVNVLAEEINNLRREKP